MPSIHFETSGTSVEFEEGEEVNVLRVAIRYGAGLPYKCASGNCGTDRIHVEKGADNLSRIRPKERERLGDEVDHGYRLACQTYASGDVVVTWDPDRKPGSMPARKQEKLREYWLAKEDSA